MSLTSGFVEIKIGRTEEKACFDKKFPRVILTQRFFSTGYFLNFMHK